MQDPGRTKRRGRIFLCKQEVRWETARDTIYGPVLELVLTQEREMEEHEEKHAGKVFR